MLLKKKKMAESIIDDIEISSNSDREDSDEETLMKKIRYRIVEYNVDFKRFMKYLYNLHNSSYKVNF